MHLVYLRKICITIVFDFSWDDCNIIREIILLVMDCVTARCGSQVQPTKMTLARQRVLRNCSECKKLLEKKKGFSKYERLPESCRATCGKPYGTPASSNSSLMPKSHGPPFSCTADQLNSFLNTHRQTNGRLHDIQSVANL